MGLNHVYKVIWNKTKGCYVVVSELAKRVGRNKAKAIVMATAAMAMVVTPAVMNVNQVEATVLIGSTSGTTISDNGSTVSSWGITIGGGITNAGSHTVHVGDATLEEGNRNVIIGTHATAGVDKIAGRHFVNQSVAIGSGAEANQGARAFGDQSVAIGSNTIAEGNSSIAIGNDDVDKAVGKRLTYKNSDGKEETSTLGTVYTNLTGKDLLNDGGQYADTRSGEAAIAIGVKAEAGDISLALGTGAKAKKVNTVSIGTGATADLENSVAIGGGALADKDSQGTKQTSTTINGITYEWAGGDKTNEGDIVSFGKPGFERQLKNIAAGEISSTSTDAINGSQIHSLVEKITGTPKLSYTTKDGTPVYKLGDKFYKVNEKGQPISAAGKPAVGTNEDGKLVDADKNVIEPIDPAVTPLKNALVNPNPAADKTGTTSPTALNNITSNLVNFDAPNVNGKVPVKNALRNLVNDAVSDDTVATVGDLRNMGWIVSADKTTGTDGTATDTAYSETVKNANEVKFVGKDGAIVSGATDAATGVRTITVGLDKKAMSGSGDSGSPVAYTKADGTKVYPVKAENGSVTYHTTPNGDGPNDAEVPKTEVITSVNGPEGTTTPAALTNVAGNLVGAKKDTNAPTTEQAAPTVGKGANEVNPNNAATVGDVLNAGWNVQENGTAKDFVKPYDKVNFVNGGNTTAVVTTNAEGTVSNVSFNVAGLPVSYTTEDGKPVSKVGDKFYKVNEQGQPVSEAGKPAVKTNDAGKLVDEDGTEIEPINPATTPLKNALVNPNPAADKTGTTSPTQLTNVEGNLDGAKKDTTAPKAEAAAPNTTNKDGDKYINPNNAATVGDVLNAGWNLQENGTAKDFVKPYDKVNFVNGGNTTAVVTTNAEGTVSNVSFNVTGLPVTYTTEDGKPVSKVGDKFYKVNEQGQPISEAGKPAVKTNDAGKLVDEDGTEIEPINPATTPLKNALVNPNPAADKTGTTSPTQLTNVEGNLDGAKKDTTAPKAEATAPNTTNKDGDKYINPNNAATVGDVLNAGWNLQENGTAKDFVKPYDKVNFVNGGNTTAVVTTNAEGTVSNVSFNVTGLPVSYTTEDGKPVSKVGDKFYKVNEQGQPISEAGKPAVKTNDAGKLVDEDGTEIEPINPATTPLKTALVNPNPAADKTETTSPTALNNVTSGLNKYGDQVDGKPVEGTTPANTGLIDLSTPADGAAPKVSNNTAATVGDLRNMGWIVSADKTTGDLDTAYSATVKNANEVKFVGTGTAIVSGETKDGVRTITVNVDDQVSTNNATTPVVYTKADGTKVYPIKGENGAITYHTTPDGKGDNDQEVPGTEVITSVNSPDGTTKPATLANVAGNLDGAKKDTTAPKAEAAAPNTTNKDGDKYINPNNAATVGDVLNAGWNLQENGTAKDFVKPYDTVNFINGANTTAVVTTSEDGTTSKVTYNVTGLPVTYTTEDGKPVSKVGDKFYKVNENGQPISEAGKPAVKTNDAGKLVDEDGTEIEPINPATTPLKNVLVNPNLAADKTGTTSPTALNNVTSGLHKYGDQVDGKPVEGTTTANTGLIDLSTPADGAAPKVSDNTAATVGDLRNMGWIVSADKTTGDLDTAYSATVKNANEVKFVGTGMAVVSGKTDDKTGVRTITVDVDNQVGTNKSVTPVEYTKKDGKKVYPKEVQEGGKTVVKFYENPEGTGTEIPNTEVITSVNGPKGTTTPTTLSNVKGNLPTVNDADKTAHDVDGAPIADKNNTVAPITAKDAADLLTPMKDGTPNPKFVGNNAATVGDVLNAGWNLQNNGTAKDFVKPYDTVNFINGGNTTAVVTTNAEGTVSNVSFNVTGLPVTYTTPDGKPVSKVGDKFYKVNEQGQPISEAGKPAVKTNDAGKLVDEDGTEIEPINPATTPLKTALVNPNPAADKTGTTSPTALNNVTSGLNKYGDQVDGKPVEGTTPANTGLIDLSTPADGAAPKVSDNTAATVGDLRNMGWIVSADKTTGDLDTAYSATVKNANEVKFVGTGTAIVSGETKDGVRTITVNVDDQVSTNNATTPVVYTKADGTKVYPIKGENGAITYHTTPDGKGNNDQEVPGTDVITSVNSPDGTTTPATLANVAGNLDGAKKDTTAPKAEAAAPNTTNKDGDKYINPNNAATVGDVLNAGWNLQENGTAKDFVKPYDTVNFINGANTTAVVTTSEDGTTSKVTYNVTGLPVTYTTEDGKPVSKVGDKFYKVNEQGQPISEAGKPAVKTNDAGKLVDEDGTEIEPINPATTPLKNALVNPNPAADKTGTTSPTALNNVTSGLNKYGDQVDGKPVEGTTPANTGLIDLSTPADGAAPKVSDNTAATVGDLRNMGWIVSADKTTGDLDTAYSATVKNANEVKFVGTGTAIVSGETKDGVRTITVNVDDQVSTNNATTPVVYTKADGTKVYPIKGENGAITYHTTPDGKGDNDQEVPGNQVVTSVNGPEGTTSPTTLKNVKNSLPTVNDVDKTAHNVDGTAIDGKNNTAAPITAKDAADLLAPMKDGAANPKFVGNNAATVSDVLNAGWNLQENGAAKDFVKPYDTVNFVNGGNTTAVVTTNAEGTVSNVSFNVTGLPVTYTTEDGKPVSKVGDKFYKVNEQGQPISEAGKPAVKTNDAGKLVDEDGTEIEPINPATTPLKTALVNPNPAADKTGTTSPTALNNVTSGLNKYGDQVDGKPVEGTTPANTGLIDLSTPADGATPKVSDNTAATVGDLRNMGWIVSADKTTGDLDKAYSATVKNANEVKFVGTGTAIVSGETKDGVRTITVNVDDQVSTNNATTPVVYTKADGTKVYPIKGENGAITYHTTPDGKGDNDQEVPGTEVITSVNSPEGTTTPATLANVAGNLDGAKKDTTAPKAEAAAPNTTNKDGDKYINPNNAATVGDVLNAGWNLQENGTAKDFVKPYDTVNFINGANTTAVVTTSEDGTTSKVTYNVTGLPVTYTTEDGKPVSKVGDKFYKVNEKGQPLAEDGTPAAGTDKDGNPITADGTVIKAIDPATEPLKTALVNPNPAADKTGTTSPTALNNVTSGLNKYGDQVDGKPVEGTTPANTGLIDLSTPADGAAPKVSDNTAATVGDLRNMGWIVSADKTTGALDTAYSATVKNANEVKFVGTGTAIVSGETKDGVRTITVNVDDQVSTNNAVTPVVYTDKEGNTVYPIKDDKGNVTYHTTPDGKGENDKVVPNGDVNTSVNGPKDEKGNTRPASLGNVKNNIPAVNDADKKVTNPDGTEAPNVGDVANINKAPLTAAEAADLLKPMKDGKANPNFAGNNAATVSDVLNAGWNLQNNGTAKDFVKPFDTVNFVNGGNTTAVVTTKADGTTSDVTFNVTGLPIATTITDPTTGKQVPVVKVGDTFYPANPDGTPNIARNDKGEPTNGYVRANDGKLYPREAVTVTPAADPTKPPTVTPNTDAKPTTVNTNLANPNVDNTTNEPGNNVNTPTQLGNIANGANTFAPVAADGTAATDAKPAVKLANDGKWYPADQVEANGKPKADATPVANPLATKNAAGDILERGNDGNWYKASDLENGEPKPNVDEQTPVVKPENAEKTGLVNFENSNPNNAATVGDLQNLGFVVAAHDNGYTEQMRNANKVEFKGSNGVSVTGKTLEDGTREITVALKEGRVTNDVIITNADGTETHGVRGEDGKIYQKDPKTGKATKTEIQVAPTDTVTNDGNAYVTGNSVATAIQKSGWNIGIGSTTKEFSTEEKTYEKVNPSDKVKYVNGDNTTVSMAVDEAKDKDGTKVTTTYVKVDVNRDLKIDSVTAGGPAKDGVPGKDGAMTVKDADGKDGVSATAKDGKGTLTLNNAKAGKDGKDAASVAISTDKAPADLDNTPKDAVRANDGKWYAPADVDVKTENGNTVVTPKAGKSPMADAPTMDRIQYKGTDGKLRDVATMDDGLRFQGDDGESISKPLNSTVQSTGGNREDTGKTVAKDATTTGNIGVFNTDGKLSVQLAKDLDKLNSANFESKTDKAGNPLKVVDGKYYPEKAVVKEGKVYPEGTVIIDNKPYPAGTTKDAAGKVVNNGKPATEATPINPIDSKQVQDGPTSKLTGTGLTFNTPVPKDENGNPLVLVDGKYYKADNLENGKPKADAKPEPVKPAQATAFTPDGLVVTPDTAKVVDPKTGEVKVDPNKVVSFGAPSIVTDPATGKPVIDPKTGEPVMKSGISAGGQVMANVAPGVLDTDAVNVSQLKGVSNMVVNVNNRVNRLGAQAAAMAGLRHLQYDPLEPTTIMAGVGTYKGEGALALGIAHYKNESTLFHAGASIGSRGDELMANAGVSWKFGSRADETAVKDTFRQGPISASYTLQDKVSALEEQNQVLKEQVAELFRRLNEKA